MHRRSVSLALASFVVLFLAACASGGQGGSSGAFSSSMVSGEDLAAIQPPITLYDYLRQHARVQFRDVAGGEAIVIEEAGRGMRAGSRYTGAAVFVDDREVADPIATVREITTAEVQRLQILTSTEASARYGGEGYTGAIAIRLR